MNVFANAHANMMKLVEEYEDLSITSLKDIQAKYSLKEIGWKLQQGILKNDLPMFTHFVSIIQMELDALTSKMEEGESQEEDYYYEEDKQGYHSGNPNVEERDKIEDVHSYIDQLSKVITKDGRPLIHLAVQAAVT